MLYGNGYAGLVMSLVASSMLVYGFDTPEIADFKLYWWTAISLVIAVRFVDAIVWQKTVQFTDFDGCKAVYRFTFGTVLTALLWSAYCLFTFPFTNTIELAFNIIVVSAMAGGSATVLAAYKPGAMLYVFILLFPFSIALLLSAEFYEYVLGILGLSFCGIMLITSRKAADFTAQAITLKNENAVLVGHMEEEVDQRTAQIYELSNIDPLTGLYNRKAFLANLRKHIHHASEQKTFALLFIDLDGFKKINDTIGHETGDLVLKQTSERLQHNCPDQQLLCRWGGDEFLVGLDDANEASAVSLAKKLIHKISDAYVFENNRLTIGATIGIAFYPLHASDENTLIQLADTAMYYQKKLSPSTAGVFSADLGHQLSREQYLKDALFDAIEKQQLRLVFQPIVDSISHQPVAFEALLRWHLNGEDIPPYEFIKIAEQYGQIRRIGAWVLHEACLTAKGWQSQQQASVSVNVSVTQLQDPDFIDMVDDVIEQSQLNPSRLHIEITESVFAADKDILLNKIAHLQNRGIQVSIDDFGTEYSSLAVIQELGANIVKIDRSFISNIDTNGTPIISAVLEIAKAFGYAVVAEGIECKSQADKLEAMGVHYLQGFYFAKPMESEQLAQYMVNNLKSG